ncbi:hypothetical protein, partial [Nostoc favosum]
MLYADEGFPKVVTGLLLDILTAPLGAVILGGSQQLATLRSLMVAPRPFKVVPMPHADHFYIFGSII